MLSSLSYWLIIQGFCCEIWRLPVLFNLNTLVFLIFIKLPAHWSCHPLEKKNGTHYLRNLLGYGTQSFLVLGILYCSSFTSFAKRLLLFFVSDLAFCWIKPSFFFFWAFFSLFCWLCNPKSLWEVNSKWLLGYATPKAFSPLSLMPLLFLQRWQFFCCKRSFTSGSRKPGQAEHFATWTGEKELVLFLLSLPVDHYSSFCFPHPRVKFKSMLYLSPHLLPLHIDVPCPNSLITWFRRFLF